MASHSKRESLTGTNVTPAQLADQARRPIFRWLMAVQLLSAGFFGVVPFLSPGIFASLSGVSGREELIYRLAGAASTGYAVVALLALARRSSWAELRIPLVATLTFTASAALGSGLAILDADLTPMVGFVLAAASVFAVLAAYWLVRDEGPTAPDRPALTPATRAILALATLSAAVFGILPLVAPGQFADWFRLDGTDSWVFRMAGAACFGYATAGFLEIRASSYPAIRLQNAAAITFNAMGATAAALAVVSGHGGLLAPVILLAAGAFTVLLVLIALDGERRARPGAPG
jgi:hypothetical protein